MLGFFSVKPVILKSYPPLIRVIFCCRELFRPIRISRRFQIFRQPRSPDFRRCSVLPWKQWSGCASDRHPYRREILNSCFRNVLHKLFEYLLLSDGSWQRQDSSHSQKPHRKKYSRSYNSDKPRGKARISGTLPLRIDADIPHRHGAGIHR